MLAIFSVEQDEPIMRHRCKRKRARLVTELEERVACRLLCLTSDSKGVTCRVDTLLFDEAGLSLDRFDVLFLVVGLGFFGVETGTSSWDLVAEAVGTLLTSRIIAGEELCPVRVDVALATRVDVSLIVAAGVAGGDGGTRAWGDAGGVGGDRGAVVLDRGDHIAVFATKKGHDGRRSR